MKTNAERESRMCLINSRTSSKYFRILIQLLEKKNNMWLSTRVFLLVKTEKREKMQQLFYFAAELHFNDKKGGILYFIIACYLFFSLCGIYKNKL